MAARVLVVMVRGPQRAATACLKRGPSACILGAPARHFLDTTSLSALARDRVRGCQAACWARAFFTGARDGNVARGNEAQYDSIDSTVTTVR